MTAQSGLGFSGLAAIQIPDDGSAGTVLTKQTADDYDYDWDPAAAAGAPANALYLVLAADPTLTDERIFTAGAGITVADGGAGNPYVVGVDPSGVDHGGLAGLADDDHLQYLLLAGRAGGQVAVGGTAISEELTLRGTTNANLGLIRAQSPIRFEDVSPAVALESFLISDAGVTQSFSAAIVIGGLSFTPVIDFSTAVFFYTAITANPVITSEVAPAFAAFVLFQGLPRLTSDTAGFSPLSTLVLNAAPTTECEGVFVALTTALVLGLSFSPQTRATVAFSTMTVTTQTAVSCAPKFSTVANSAVGLGTIRGLHCQVPSVALFQPQVGSEVMDAYIGLDYDNINTFGDAADIRVVVRSALASNTNNFFLQHTGTAVSTIGGQVAFPLDLTGLTFGLQGDCSIGYAAGDFLFFNYTGFGAGILGQWRFGTAVAGVTTQRHLWSASVQDAELNINVDRFSLGAQSGANGNQVGAFVTPVRTAGVAGAWADFLLTQGGTLDIAALVMSDVSAWLVNSISLLAATGSITELAALKVGGMTVSNPGITVTERAALWSTGRFLQRGSVQYPPIDPTTLAAGNTNDWAGLLTATPSNSTRYWARMVGDAGGTSVITGIDSTAIQDGDSFELTNVGTVNVTLGHQDANSVAANRFISPSGANYVLGADESVVVRYDSTTTRWRILQGTGA